MDNINDLIGDAAKQLMVQADGIQNQKLKASAQRVAQTISAKTRDELISVARSDAYGRDTRFIKYLPITWRQKAVMGARLQLPVHDEQGRHAGRIPHEPCDRRQGFEHHTRQSEKRFASACRARFSDEALERRSQARDVSRR